MRPWMLAVLVCLAGPAEASPGKLKKATKQVEAFESGDRDALVDAWDAIEQAVTHPKVEGDGMAWALRGRIALAFLTNPDLPAPEGDLSALALSSFQEAHELGAVGLAEPVLALESALASELVNHVEGKRWDEATARLAQALAVRELAQQVASRDEQREVEVRSLAVRITGASGALDEALDHYEELVGLGRLSPGLAGMLVRELAEAGRHDDAMAFLEPLAAQAPGDERLLRAEVELLVDAGRTEDAVARIDRAREELSTSVSGAFLVAGLYQDVGAIDRARSAWEAVLQLDPRHRSSMVALGASLIDEGVALREQVEGGVEGPLAEQEDEQLRADLADLWARAEGHLTTARELDRQSVEVLEALIALYEAKWDAVDAQSLDPDEQERYDADQASLEDARAALHELRGT